MSETLGAEFEPIEVLHVGRHSKVLRCRHKGGIVIVKTHPEPFAKRAEVELLHREFQIGRLIASNSAHSARYISMYLKEFDKTKRVAAIVMEDCGGMCLANVLPKDGFSIPKFLDVAIQCTFGLQSIHRNNIIHKDVKPANMVSYNGHDFNK
jgi:serine/threonine protein kinase